MTCRAFLPKCMAPASTCSLSLIYLCIASSAAEKRPRLHASSCMLSACSPSRAHQGNLVNLLTVLGVGLENTALSLTTSQDDTTLQEMHFT